MDAGLYRPASLGDYVWEDLNGNGQQDNGEPGIDGVTVRLCTAGQPVLVGPGDDAKTATLMRRRRSYLFATWRRAAIRDVHTPGGYADAGQHGR